MNVDKNMQVHLIAPDGGLRLIPTYLVNELKKKGWIVVINPKRNYFPEYDKTHPNYKKEQLEQEKQSDILKVEVL